MHDIAERLEGWFTDWNGARMVPGEPPRDGIHCDVLMEAKAEIEKLRTELSAERERCIGIVNLARSGEIDGDLRAIISRIRHGETLAAIAAERNGP